MFVTVTGGSGSGKSAFAEEQILKFPEKNRLYIATMVCFDEESRQRVKRHRKMRKEKHFDTLECPTDLVHVRIPKDTAVLLECMSNLAANEVFSPEGAKEHAYEAICDGILHLKEQAADVCVVTNEIFSGIFRSISHILFSFLLSDKNLFPGSITLRSGYLCL